MDEPFKHELAVLRPTPGDVVVLYVDLARIQSAEMVGRFMRDLRGLGIVAGILPEQSVLTLSPGQTADDLRHTLDDWLRPFGYRAVKRED